MKSDARLHALNILDIFRKTGSRLNSIRNDYFSEHLISATERQRILVLTRELLRWKGRLDLFLQQAADKPLSQLAPRLLIILELATYEILLDDSIPAYAAINNAVELTRSNSLGQLTGLVNAILRKIDRTGTAAISKDQIQHDHLADWYSTPQWLFKRWADRYGLSATEDLCDYYNSPVPLSIRRNRKISHSELMHLLKEEDIIAVQRPDAERFYDIRKGGSKLLQLEVFLNGRVSFQDRAAGAVVEILDPQPGEIILDVCAAPGTKTLYITERMNDRGQVFASDSDENRIKMAAKDQVRHGLNSIHWDKKDATKDVYPLADRILVDAPCTGTGVIGRRPDIKWRRQPEHIAEMAVIQSAILSHISRFLKPGGILVYSTCSMEPEENWKVVEAFLKLHSHYMIEEISNIAISSWIMPRGFYETFPPRDNLDGMFAAKLKIME